MQLTGVSRLWVADITYIRLHHEFVFVAVILDAFSRKVVGWELARTFPFLHPGSGGLLRCRLSQFLLRRSRFHRLGCCACR
jgi:transposase InsO family protein